MPYFSDGRVSQFLTTSLKAIRLAFCSAMYAPCKQMSSRHLGLDGDTKLLLALSHFLNRPSRVRLLGVPELPRHADVQCR